MATVDSNGYVRRARNGARSGRHSKETIYRNWWLVKAKTETTGCVFIRGFISLPPEYIGKRVRLKVEVIK